MIYRVGDYLHATMPGDVESVPLSDEDGMRAAEEIREAARKAMLEETKRYATTPGASGERRADAVWAFQRACDQVRFVRLLLSCRRGELEIERKGGAR